MNHRDTCHRTGPNAPCADQMATDDSGPRRPGDPAPPLFRPASWASKTGPKHQSADRWARIAALGHAESATARWLRVRLPMIEQQIATNRRVRGDPMKFSTFTARCAGTTRVGGPRIVLTLLGILRLRHPRCSQLLALDQSISGRVQLGTRPVTASRPEPVGRPADCFPCGRR